MHRADCCPQCGCPYFANGNQCTNCGFQLPVPMGKLVIFGIRQGFLLGGTITAMLDGVPFGKVEKNAAMEIPIARPCRLSVKCGINYLSKDLMIYPGRVTQVQVTYNRWLGTFGLEIVH